MKVRTFLLVATHLVAGAIGALLAVWWVVDDLRRMNATTSDMVLLSYYSAHLDLQRTEGGPIEYRDALLGYLEVLDELHKSSEGFFPPQTGWTDRMLTRVRLSQLEDHAGNKAVAAAHMREARAACEKIPWDNCEPDHLVGVVRRIERNALLRSGENTS